MIEVEIYFQDLKKAKQKELLALYEVSTPEDMNWDVFPITTFDVCLDGESTDAINDDE
jgi:hypothetical protein